MTTTTSTPATMQGVFLPGDGTAELRPHDVPVPGAGQVLVKATRPTRASTAHPRTRA
jgi:hypothetical protein